MSRLRIVAPRVYVASSLLYLTNSVVIEGSSHNGLVIDPAVTVKDLISLGIDLRKAELRTEAGFSTHAHWDHVLWNPALGNAPRYATDSAIQSLQAHRDAMFAEMVRVAPGHPPDLFGRGRLTPLPPEMHCVPWSGPLVQLMRHSAHAPGHAALFVQESGVLICGDMLSDVEIPLLDLTASDPLKDYRDGLHLLSTVDPELRIFIPGHGHVGYGNKEFQYRIGADLKYLDSLEEGLTCTDSRLSVPWLQAEHNTQWSHFHGHNEPKRG